VRWDVAEADAADRASSATACGRSCNGVLVFAAVSSFRLPVVDGIAQDGPEVVSLAVAQVANVRDEVGDIVVVRVANGGVFTDQSGSAIGNFTVGQRVSAAVVGLPLLRVKGVWPGSFGLALVASESLFIFPGMNGFGFGVGFGAPVTAWLKIHGLSFHWVQPVRVRPSCF